MAAFGLEPARSYAALLAAPRNGRSGEQIRREVAEELDRRRVRYLSTARRDRAAFLVEAASEDEILGLAETIVEAGPDARVGVGRPAQGRALGRSLLEARAALDAAGATSPRTATSARWSSCSACRTRRSRPSSTACSARPPTASG